MTEPVTKAPVDQPLAACWLRAGATVAPAAAFLFAAAPFIGGHGYLLLRFRSVSLGGLACRGSAFRGLYAVASAPFGYLTGVPGVCFEGEGVETVRPFVVAVTWFAIGLLAAFALLRRPRLRHEALLTPAIAAAAGLAAVPFAVVASPLADGWTSSLLPPRIAVVATCVSIVAAATGLAVGRRSPRV